MTIAGPLRVCERDTPCFSRGLQVCQSVVDIKFSVAPHGVIVGDSLRHYVHRHQGPVSYGDIDGHEDEIFVEKGNSPVYMSDRFVVEGGPVGWQVLGQAKAE